MNHPGNGQLTQHNNNMEDITNDQKRLAEIAEAVGSIPGVTAVGAGVPAVLAGEAASTPAKKPAAPRKPRASVPGVPMLRATVEAKRFARSVAMVRGACGKGGTLAVLGSICIEKEPGMPVLRLRATNLDLAASLTIPVNEEGLQGDSGGLCVPAKGLQKLLAEVDADDLHLEFTGGKLKLTAGHWRAELLGLELDAWPQGELARTGDRVELGVLPEVVLQRMLAFTLPAVSVDETRYVLNGIYLARGAGLRAVGTDGRRLTLMTMEDDAADDDEEPWEIILPTKAAGMISAAAAVDDKATVMLWGFRDHAGKWLAVEVELASGLVVQAKVISGQYPNYAQVIPDKILEQVTVNGQALAEMCGRAGVINADSVCIVMEDRDVVVSSEMMDVGRWREEDAIVADDGQPCRRVEVQVNPAYVGVLALGVSGRLDVGHARNAGPLVWRASVPAGEEELRLTGVMMPIRKEGGAE